MITLARALLLGGSMAVSAVSIALGSGCYDMQSCPFNECAQAWYPNGQPCCTPTAKWYYSCDVTLEGNPPNVDVYHDVTVAGCYATADEAQADAPAVAQATFATEYPDTTGRGAVCAISACPEVP